MAKNPYANYSNQKFFTASKEELVLMLYDGGIKFANQAIKAIEDKELGKAHELITRVQDIVREFQITLDRSIPISENLYALYDYMFSLLVTANIKKEIEPIAEARDMLKELRGTWKEAMVLSKSDGSKAENSKTLPFKAVAK